MSEQPTTTETTDDTRLEDQTAEHDEQQHDDAPADADEQHDDADETDDDQRNPNAEAAKYRRRLRETEAERDSLKATLDQLRRDDIERIVGERLSVPGDVFTLGGLEIEAVLDEQGRVVPELVDTVVHGLLTERPGLATPPPMQKFPSGIGLGNRGPGPTGTSWSEVIRSNL